MHPDSFTIEEQRVPYVAVTERHLQAVWLEQKYFKHLKTFDGRDVTVISPGIWNAEAGPDFKKAHLRIGGVEVKGDIEIHLSDEGWRLHKHHLDERYNEVVFHVSLWKPKVFKELERENGKKIELSHLEQALTIPIARVVKLIDLDLYPYHTHAGTGKCSQLLFHKLSQMEVHYFFQTAAEWRLKKKWEKLTGNGQSREEAFIEGMSMALGYKHNANAFVDLCRALKRRQEFSREELFSHALAICGYFSEPYTDRWKECLRYRELRDKISLSAEASIPLMHHQVRPFNHPVRRILYLVNMLRDPALETLCERLLRTWQACWEDWSHDPKGAKTGRKQLEGMIPVYTDLFFESHYIFGSKPSDIALPLMGKTLVHTILANVFFPLLYDSLASRENQKELEFFLTFFQQLPSEETGKIEYLNKRFFGTSKLKLNGMMEQGAYQLHRDFCLHYEASCEGCPFVGRYKEVYAN